MSLSGSSQPTHGTELLERAGKGSFMGSSLRDLPGELISQAFGHSGEFYSVLKDFRENIEFAKQDIRKELPDGTFHLILCRNIVFTYFDELQQRGDPHQDNRKACNRRISYYRHP